MIDCLYLWFALGFHCCGFVVVGLGYVVWFVCCVWLSGLCLRLLWVIVCLVGLGGLCGWLSVCLLDWLVGEWFCCCVCYRMLFVLFWVFGSGFFIWFVVIWFGLYFSCCVDVAVLLY